MGHPRFGVDIQIKINPDDPYGYYDIELVERTQLSPEELAYPLLSLEVKPETLIKAKREWQKLKSQYAGEQPLKPEGPIVNWAGWGRGRSLSQKNDVPN